jgi:hypothetical protein
MEASERPPEAENRREFDSAAANGAGSDAAASPPTQPRTADAAPAQPSEDYSPQTNPLGDRPAYRTSIGGAAASHEQDLFFFGTSPGPSAGAGEATLASATPGGAEPAAASPTSAAGSAPSPAPSEGGASNMLTPGGGAAALLSPRSPLHVPGCDLSPPPTDTAGSCAKPRAAAATAAAAPFALAPQLSATEEPPAAAGPSASAASGSGATPAGGAETAPAPAASEPQAPAQSAEESLDAVSEDGSVASRGGRERFGASPAELLRRAASKMRAQAAVCESGLHANGQWRAWHEGGANGGDEGEGAFWGP